MGQIEILNCFMDIKFFHHRFQVGKLTKMKGDFGLNGIKTQNRSEHIQHVIIMGGDIILRLNYMYL